MAKNPGTLGSGTGSFDANWDWKGEYVSSLGDNGYENFSQFSVTPDTTALYAGPARFSALGATGVAKLTPIGLTDGISIAQDAQLARLFEIGSNRSFFTRGKSAPYIGFGRMLADTKNVIAALSQNATRNGLYQNTAGTKGPGAQGANSQIMMNLDSEYTAIPFGLLLLFKTRGSDSSTTSRGKIMSAVYLEYCMFQSYNFGIQAASPVVMENIAIQYDRPVPVAIG